MQSLTCYEGMPGLEGTSQRVCRAKMMLIVTVVMTLFLCLAERLKTTTAIILTPSSVLTPTFLRVFIGNLGAAFV